MLATTMARFWAVSLSVLLATMTTAVCSAYQVPESPPTAGAQVAGPQAPPTRQSTPETDAAPQSPNAAAEPSTAPPASRAVVPPQSPAQFGPAQPSYSSAWQFSGQLPNGRSSYGSSGSSVLTPPTGRAGTSRYPAPLGSGGGRSSFTSQAAAQSMSAPRMPVRGGASQKPFSGYTRQSGVSPYMNLYRSTGRFGGVDNYNSLVRPMLRQRQENRQTQLDLQRLRMNSGAQGTQLQQLNQRTSNVRGTGQPNRFRNFHDYYPGLRK